MRQPAKPSFNIRQYYWPALLIGFAVVAQIGEGLL